MTAVAKLHAGAPSVVSEPWDRIDWPAVEKEVNRLQMRIAKALREGRYGKVKALQWLLTHSHYGKLLAVRRVTQNKGSKTPGVDGIVWRSNKQKTQATMALRRRGYMPQPLRRIYIPKKNGKMRPLGIPTMHCRAFQALHLLALEPVSEHLSDKNSYGFRPKRSCADAIEQCFKILCRKKSAGWILEGDIKSCFDKISHPWLLEHIPMDKQVLGKWLSSGYVDRATLFPTLEGTPQGGIVSPTLLNLTLRGLEQRIAAATRSSEQVNVVVYADDFVISGASRDVLENKVKPLVVEFLKERGLTLSEEKTVITHINQGFDFLGFNVRKYEDKLLIKPSSSNVKTFLAKIREVVKKHPTAKTENLIRLINPKIRGWANYFRHSVAKDTFSFVDHRLFEILWQWAKRRHPNRSSRWIWQRYFANPVAGRGCLAVRVGREKKAKIISVFKASSVPIRRHVKIKSDATPYDPEFLRYFQERAKKNRDPMVTPSHATF